MTANDATGDGRIERERDGQPIVAGTVSIAESGPGGPRTDSRANGTGSGQPTRNRREFLGALGSVAATGLVAAGAGRAHESRTVRMETNYFDPVGLFVEPGTTVRFEVVEGSHSATAYESRIPDGATAFDTGVISSGGVSVTFDTPGTYDYYCKPHESMGMVGRIVVGSPGGPAEDSPIPAGDVPESETIVERGAIRDGGTDSSGQGGPAGMGGGMNGGMEGGGGGSGGPGGHGGMSGWQLLFPLGMMTTLLGTVGAVVYGATRLGRASDSEPGD